jgi:hypothetical protein
MNKVRFSSELLSLSLSCHHKVDFCLQIVVVLNFEGREYFPADDVCGLPFGGGSSQMTRVNLPGGPTPHACMQIWSTYNACLLERSWIGMI